MSEDVLNDDQLDAVAGGIIMPVKKFSPIPNPTTVVAPPPPPPTTPITRASVGTLRVP